jgi:hypothetical protein
VIVREGGAVAVEGCWVAGIRGCVAALNAWLFGSCFLLLALVLSDFWLGLLAELDWLSER